MKMWPPQTAAARNAPAQKLSDQLNLAHVARKKMKKNKRKQTNTSAYLIQYRFKIREGSRND